jgi:head-tail adaptor
METNVYNSTFNVYKPIYSTKPFGNVTLTYTLSTQNQKCYITLLDGRKTLYNGKINEQASHRLFCNTNVDIQITDRIVSDNKTFNILYINNVNVMEHHLEILLEQV